MASELGSAIPVIVSGYKKQIVAGLNPNLWLSPWLEPLF
jgi:hypothetical protein